jgi:hypothetical protein
VHPGASSEFIIRAVHDVVGEQLRAAGEQLRERLLALFSVELVLLLHRDPGQLAPLPLDLLLALGLLCLEPRELVARRLPFLTGSDLVLGISSPSSRARQFRPGSASVEAIGHP